MHVVYVHKNFPAQFGHLAHHLIEHHGFQCTFVSERAPPPPGPIRYLQYKVKGGATARNHYCSRTIESFTWHNFAVYETLKAHPEIKPDLVVGHSGFGSTLFLGELYDCPIINYCEWYYQPEGSDSDFRTEMTRNPLNPLRSRMRNSALLVDLQSCTAGYSPTNWQRTRLPAEYQYKLQTIFDGMNTDFWRQQPAARDAVRRVGNREIPPGVRIVTYVSRGFETVRGFDVFMKIAETICRMRRDVIFVCVGSDKSSYGDDSGQTRGKTLREHLLAQGNVDPDRFIFTGQVPPTELARIFNLSDLHLYLTVPFVLSWSMLNAMSCGCVVLASDTEPVREVIDHGRNGLLASFYDVEGFVARALEVLDDPAAHRFLRDAAARTIRARYSMRVIVPKMLELYQRTLSAPPRPPVLAPRDGRPEAAAPAAIQPAGPAAPAQVVSPSPVVSVVDVNAPDPLDELARQHPWPKGKPGLAGCEDCRWMRPAQEQMLAGVLNNDTRLVVEVGAWTGLSTRALARHAPRAKVIAVDSWCGVSDPVASAGWKAALPEVYQRFLVNCWELRDRVVPLPSAPADGLVAVHERGLLPQVVYLSLDHCEPVERILRLACELFPAAVLLGKHWGWPRLRQAIGAIAEKAPLKVEVADSLWKLWRKP